MYVPLTFPVALFSNNLTDEVCLIDRATLPSVYMITYSCKFTSSYNYTNLTTPPIVVGKYFHEHRIQITL